MKLKQIIIILTILVIILLFMLLVLLNYQKNNKNSGNKLAAELVDIPIEVKESIQQVDIRNDYYVVQSCISKFYTFYSDIFKDITDGYKIIPEFIDEEEIKRDRLDKVYKLLDVEYLNYKGITLENISEKLPKVGDITININKMYVIEKEDGISIYFAYGNKKDTLDQKVTDFAAMVKVDMRNRTYKILLEDYLKNNYNNVEIGQSIDIKENEIENEIYNTFTYEHITDEEYVNDLFSHYKNNLRLNKEKAFDLIDDEYKKQCFINLEDYLSYINENYSRIVTTKIDSYGKYKNSEYTQYILKDTDENYYIFRETGIFNYKVIPDTYVIPMEDFITEYNTSSGEEKVTLNIKRFFMGIDDKNYGYSYNVLSEGFKNNQFKTKEDFINFAKQNFFEENKIKYLSYEEENGLYIYKIELTDATGKNKEQRAFNIIVKLNDGTDFEMSFSRQ